jgi:hypothetical protein
VLDVLGDSAPFCSKDHANLVTPFASRDPGEHFGFAFGESERNQFTRYFPRFAVGDFSFQTSQWGMIVRKQTLTFADRVAYHSKRNGPDCQ